MNSYEGTATSALAGHPKVTSYLVTIKVLISARFSHSGSMMMQFVRTLAVGAVVWTFVHSIPVHAQVNIDVVVGVAPPVAIVEPPPPPRVGFIWAPGFWQWDGHAHVWQAGHWEAQQEGELYVASQWVEAPGGWRFVPAHWKRGKHFKHHDDDGDDDRDGHFCPPGQAKKGRC